MTQYKIAVNEEFLHHLFSSNEQRVRESLTTIEELGR
jgi:hypothetical protein